MRTLLFVLFPIILSAQSYVTLDGGIQDFTDTKPAFSAGLHHNVGKLGGNIYYMYRENGVRDVDALGTRITYSLLEEGFYVPMLSFGAQVLPNISTIYGLHNYFRVQDNLSLSLSYQQLGNISYTSLGIRVKITPVEKGFRPRFF